MPNAQPIFLRPHYDARPWGGTALNSHYAKHSPHERTGESWEISAMPQGLSVCSFGGFESMTLSELFANERALFGGEWDEFPLLIKLIDARETLSVQVHPDDSQAILLDGQRRGKTEAWAVLSAEKGAQLAIGADIESGQELIRAIESDTLSKKLIWRDVAKGDVWFIPAGTLHAIGGGITLYEIQQASDSTYRVHDWGRGRELHIEKSAQVYKKDAGYGSIKPTYYSKGRETLVKCPYFELQSVNASDFRVDFNDNDVFWAFTALGDGEIEWNGGKSQYNLGNSFIIPARFGGFSLSGGILYAGRP